MNNLPRVSCVAWAVAWCLFAPPVRALEAGAAKIEIVPGAGVPLDGDFARRGRPATGTRSPLYVRALYLQEGETALFIVSADLFAITPDLRARVIEKAPVAVPRENIVLAATHTLNGPGGFDHSWLGRQRGGRFMAEELDAVAATFAAAMQTAYDVRTRASAGYAAMDTALVANRFDPAAPVDGQLGVLRVDDSDGNPIALLANLGAAPQGTRDLVFSADFPGAFCTALEGMTASTAVAMFLNGASGDQIPAATDGMQTFAEALAGQVKGLANEIKCREVTLAFSHAAQEMPLHSASPFYPDEGLFQVIEIDRLAMLFMSPIPRGEIGIALRKAVVARGYAQCMVVAPANGYLGAVASVETIARAEERSEPVYLGPAAAAWLVESATAPLAHGASAVAEKPLLPERPLETRDGLVYLAHSGTAAEIGAQRGLALRRLDGGAKSFPDLPARWLESAAGGVLGHWNLMRSAVAVESLALPVAGENARSALRSVGAETLQALAEMSAESRVPFGQLWLRQLAPSSDSDAPVGPAGVAFGMSTIDNGFVLAQSIEWPEPVEVTVTRVKAKTGHSYVVVGLPWHVGGTAGVNDRGVAIAVASSQPEAGVAIAVPAETVIAEVLAHAATFDDALAILSTPRIDATGRVLVAFDDGARSQSAIVELGVSPTLTLDPVALEFARDDLAPSPRDVRIQHLLDGLNAPTVADAERIVADRDRRASAADRVLSTRTRACVVLVPRQRELCVMAPDAAGTPRAFEVVSVRGDES